MNPNLQNTAEVIRISLNIIGAGVAGWINIWSMRHGPREWAGLRLVVGVLAFIYSFGWALLVIFPIERAIWSQYIGGLGPLAWAIAWAGPPLLTERNWRRIVGEIKGKLDEDEVVRLEEAVQKDDI